ncbi:MAG: two-component regulator propeller domain-containing protein, partial [Ginsengibacter sp.]
MKRLLIIYCCFSSVCYKSLAQQPSYIFQHLTTKDGLGSNFVQSVFQDSRGLYWVSTTSGLQTFDGYNFSKPLNIGNDLLASSTVIEDRDGLIWISTATSLYRYNRINNQFKLIASESALPEMNFKIYEDAYGRIWLVNRSKIYNVDIDKGRLTVWMELPPGDLALTGAVMAYAKKFNKLWIQNGSTLYEISLLRKEILKKEPMLYQAANMGIESDSILWISSWSQNLCRYNTVSNSKEWFTMPSQRRDSKHVDLGVATCFLQDTTGKVWIGSLDAGLWFFDNKAHKLNQIPTNNLKTEAFHRNEYVYSIMIDKEGAFWISTDDGLNVTNPLQQKFFSLNNTDLPRFEAAAQVCRKPFQTSTGNILLASNYGGWFLYDQHFKFLKRFSAVLSETSTFLDTCKTMANCFTEDKSGNIWIGYNGGLIGIYQPKTGVLEYQMVKEFGKKKVCDIQCDTSGNIWFALRRSDSNLVKWDAKLKKFKIYHDGVLHKLAAQESSILITKDNAIWVQTFGNGVYHFDPLKQQIVEIFRDKELPFKIPSSVQGISNLNDSCMVVASFDEGFFVLNNNRKSIERFNTAKGLPSNLAKGIATDQYDNYWITTLSDLIRFNPLTTKIISFDEDDGVLNRSFYPGFTKLQDGRLCVLTTTGLIYFHPNSIKIQLPPPDVLIADLKVSAKSVLIDSILKANSNVIQLKYDQNFLSLDYVSISYFNRKKNKYYYKLQGLEKEWIEAGTQRTATYTNLSPGKYIFMVRCQNRDGIFSKNITTLNIVISPPWWRTWWAYTLYVLMLAGFIFLIYRNRISLLEKKQQAEIKTMVETQEEERKRISRDLHDEVGTKLSALKLFVSSLHDKASAV